MTQSDFFKLLIIGFGISLFRCGPLPSGRFEDLPGPDAMFRYVPWFLDPGKSVFALPKRLDGAAFDDSERLCTSDDSDFGAQ